MDKIGQARLYKTLCGVLDSLRAEAPPEFEIYHPVAGNHDGLIQARSRAFLHLFLKARFGLVQFADRENLVTDGKFDGGIDAYYIDNKNKFIYILQSKFRATAGNFVSSNMGPNDLLKMDVKKIMNGVKRDEQGNIFNDKILKNLQKSVQKISDIASWTTQVVLLGNAKLFTPGELKKLIDGYPVEQYAHDRAYRELLFPLINGTYFSDPNLTIEINLANIKGDTHLDYDVKANSLKTNIKLLFVPTREIGRIMHIYKNSVLKYNPRSFLEIEKNPVNKDIENSIKSVANNEFALFNNGITIISDQTSISSDTAKQETAQIVLRNPQLVNGGQTAFTLGRIYEECLVLNDFAIFKGKEVLLKVITFIGAAKPATSQLRLKLLGDISKASNSQTKIEDSDRRSNDLVQINLQSEFFEKYGLYYERKRGEFSSGIHSGYIKADMLVDRDKLIRVCLASDYRASQSRSSIKPYFKEEELSKLINVTDIEKYAYGYEMMRLIEQERKKVPKDKSDRYAVQEFGQALRYGQYSLLAVCINEGLKHNTPEVAALERILSQWKDFEDWAVAKKANSAYKSNSSFDFANYYKGGTSNNDLKAYPFSKVVAPKLKAA